MNAPVRRRLLLGAAALPLAPAAARAQQGWPTRPVAVTVGLQAGTGSDVAVRNLMQKVSVALGQPVVVSNLLGAAGLVAAQHGAKQPPDGYGLVALSGAVVTTLPHLQRGTFNPIKELVPVAMIVSFPSVISVHKDVPANTIQEFLELARRNPGKYSYASGGVGSVQHTAMEQLKAMAGIDLLHVPYKGMAQATTDLVGGQVNSAIQGVVAVIPFAKTGQVKVLAWTGRNRNPLFPQIPTLHEAGVTGYSFQSWTALFGPPGMPAPVIERLNAEVRKAAAAPDLREQWTANGMETIDASPAQIAAMIREENEQMAQLIRKTGMKLE
jgi:tripartite-type tricarboxylate transporter receptor subunit TctC